MVEFEDVLLEPFPVDGLTVPLIKLTTDELPHVEVKVGDREYAYDRSYPIKGYSAVLPQYLQEQMGAGKTPLIIERPTRFYVYFAK